MTSFPLRAQFLTVLVILSNVAGNALLSAGVKKPSALPLLTGVLLLAVWTVSRTTLMSWADLSFVLPVTAVGYVLTTAVGVWFLDEQVTLTRWAATGLIVLGTMLAGSTRPKTTPERNPSCSGC
jgi:drug/metabolite transporter (DMT)-like permease